MQVFVCKFSSIFDVLYRNLLKPRKSTRPKGVENDESVRPLNLSSSSFDLDLWPPHLKVDSFMLLRRGPFVPICIKISSFGVHKFGDGRTNGHVENKMTLPASLTVTWLPQPGVDYLLTSDFHPLQKPSKLREPWSQTSCNAHYSHDTDDRRVDRNETCVHFLEYDSNYGQHHYCQVQLIPPDQTHSHISSHINSLMGTPNYSATSNNMKLMHAVDGWGVTFSTARRGLRHRPAASSLYQM